MSVAAPVDFMDGALQPVPSARLPVPGVGEHTEEVLRQFGVSAADVAQMGRRVQGLLSARAEEKDKKARERARAKL